MAGKIFINYRRDDSIGMAGRLHDRLAQTFGRDNLFMDVDHIPVGVDFVTHLNSQVAACDVILVVIGRNWLKAKDKAGQRRLHQPEDFVAIEIAAALARDIRVIPILVDGARMPKESELPDSLKPLVRRQAAEVRHAHFGKDAETLVARMRETFGDETLTRGREACGDERGDEKAGPDKWRLEVRSWPRTAIAAAAAAILLPVGWLGVSWMSAPGSTVTRPPVDDAIISRPANTVTRPSKMIIEPQQVPNASNEQVPNAANEQQQVRRPLPVPQDCLPGYVWREAYRNDRVCVTQETHNRTLEGNRLAASRRKPGGGEYGSDTCGVGFVWREADMNDHVCVTPETREQVRYDNSKALSRSKSAPTSVKVQPPRPPSVK